MGSKFGAVAISPANIGTSTNPFTSVGSVTGNVLATSNNGALAVFSDTTLSPNQVFIVNSAGGSSPAVTALNITGASAAAFSLDGLKAFIFGFDSNNNPNLYIYSTLQALQTIPLPPGTTVSTIAFSTNGAFAYVVEPSLSGGGPAFTVYNTCDNQISTFINPTTSQIVPQVIPLAAPPIAFNALPDGIHLAALESDGNIEYISASIAPVVSATPVGSTTPTAPVAPLCPMHVNHPVQLQRTLNLQQGTIHPLDFFPSADGTLLYVLASDRASVLVYNFATGATTGIELTGNATPLAGFMTPDAGTIVIAGSDGMLHEVSTALGGTDMAPPLSFPNLPNYLNPFCTYAPAQCSLNLVATKP
jgi:hypothetical protein